MRFKIQKTFSSAHFYHQPQWTEEQNRAQFGKCFTIYGHGHDYTLDLEFQDGSPLKVQALVEELIQRLDHQHLNFTIADFKSAIPTTENIALYIQREILKLSARDKTPIQLLSLKLQENPEIWVELPILREA